MSTSREAPADGDRHRARSSASMVVVLVLADRVKSKTRRGCSRPRLFVGCRPLLMIALGLLYPGHPDDLRVLPRRRLQRVRRAGQLPARSSPTSDLLSVLRNTVVWVVLTPADGDRASACVYAILVDRARFEKFAKSLIFLPMAISLVGACIIWKFVYDYRSPRTSRSACSTRSSRSLGVRHLPVPAHRALEHVLPDRHHGLGPGRFRDDRPVRRDQGDPGRHRRGRPARRRQRAGRCSATSRSRASGRR